MSLDAQIAREQFPDDCRRCPRCKAFTYFRDDYPPYDPAKRTHCYVCKLRGEAEHLHNLKAQA
jgi:hypothetical protein